METDSNLREKVITRVSVLGIVSNVIIALIKVIVGIIASSIAIISEGVNNASDALTSVLTLAGTKLAQKKPDSKHPFGYGRIEYITGLVISVVILVAGFESFTGSVKLIINPEPLSVSVVSLVIVAVSAVIKFIIGVYTIKKGKETGSSGLEAVGKEGKSDAFASIITIVSSAVFLIFGVSIDAYAGIAVSALIIKAGIEVLLEMLSELIGRSGEKELAVKLYSIIRSTPGIIAAEDMMLHNYGPDSWSGSVNLEIDHNKTIGEVYDYIHDLQLRIMHEFKVTMVFGLYAVDNDNPDSKELRKNISNFIRSNENIKSYHAVYRDDESKKIYCDFIVDYKLKDWGTLTASFTEYIKNLYPGYETELTVETEFV